MLIIDSIVNLIVIIAIGFCLFIVASGILWLFIPPPDRWFD